MDFGPVYQQLFTTFWYLIPLLIIVGLIKSPWFKGKFGEFLVNLSARCFLDKSRYHLIKNVTLPTEDGTTQIDHVLVSEFGVFVVETKNMKGWIFGSPHQGFWTQKIFRSGYKFQNPLHQNYKHAKTLQALLGLGAPPSELFLARQDCNSLIAAAIGNQDPRLLRDRDKACARYNALKGEVH